MSIDTESTTAGNGAYIGNSTPLGNSTPGENATAGGHTEAAIESAPRIELHEKIAQLKDDIRSIGELSGRIAGDTLISLADEAIKGLTSLTDGAADQGRTVVAKLQDAIHDRPIKSMALSAGLGAIVACMILRR